MPYVSISGIVVLSSIGSPVPQLLGECEGLRETAGVDEDYREVRVYLASTYFAD